MCVIDVLHPQNILSCCAQQPLFVKIFMHTDDQLSVIRNEMQRLYTPPYLVEFNSSLVCMLGERDKEGVSLTVWKKSNTFGLKLAVQINHGKYLHVKRFKK